MMSDQTAGAADAPKKSRTITEIRRRRLGSRVEPQAQPKPDRSAEERRANEQLIALKLDTLRGRIALTEHLQGGKGNDAATRMLENLTALHLAARRKVEEAREAHLRLHLPAIVERFQLTQQEEAVLVLALAPYLDPEIPAQLRKLADAWLLDRCTVGLALRILAQTSEERLQMRALFDDTATLRREGLLDTLAPPGQPDAPLLERLLTVPTRIVDHVLGRVSIDEQVRPFCALTHPSVELHEVVLPKERLREVMDLVQHHDLYRSALETYGFDNVMPYGKGIVLLLAGEPGTGKTLLANALANELGRPLLRVHSDRLAENQEGVEPIVAALFREADLHHAVVLFDDCESLFRERGSRLSALLGALEQSRGIIVLTTNLPQVMDFALERRIVYRFDFDIPTPEYREQLWECHLPPDAPLSPDVDIPTLANEFRFSGGTIKNAVVVALNKALNRNPRDPVIDMALLREAAATQLRYSLDEFSVKSNINLTLDDLVLPEDEMTQVRELLAAARNREYVMNRWGFGRKLVTGKGLVSLFDGPPGTGKTLTAEILATELSKSLFRVSIPRIVSKYVGETEKHIEELFARARASHAMLLFDEADALFSRRTSDTKSSTDRYANMEVNLLLQEIERFEGIVVLTTNLFGALDEALIRRIQFRISFPFPDADERLRIWRTLLPPEAPLAPDVSLELIADDYELAGGNIKNALLRAAYRACELGTPLDSERLEEACERECRAMGKVFRTRNFPITAPPVAPLNPTNPTSPATAAGDE
ncbi:MAG: hypothetical protein AMXMBFR64_40230 [Myxococcales bacterium]